MPRPTNTNPLPQASASFGTLLRYLRRRAHLTQAALAQATDYSVSQISRFEQDAQRPPDSATLEALFLPALHLHDAPELAQRLLTLAQQERTSGSPVLAAPSWSNLPAPATPLIGREADVAAVLGFVQRPTTRMLSLLGPPGVGKTRLALASATAAQGHFAHGICFVDLTPLNDAAFVITTIARALELKDLAQQSVAEVLTRHLRERHLLLLLDNFEHVLVAAAPIATLLAACPQLHVLITSRVALHVRPEQRFPVAPLAPAPALALFTERAQALQPAFALHNGDHEAAAAICARLDGIPLALELAATQLARLSLAELRQQLERPLELLQNGPRDLPAHQQALRTAIGWSYALLTPKQQRLFITMGVCSGGCDEAALAALAGEGPLEASLAALVQASLVQAHGSGEQPRYSLLETMREFAREQLERQGQLAAACQRHAAYYLALAQQAHGHYTGHQAPHWVQRIDRELANLRVALRWYLDTPGQIGAALSLGAALWQFWFACGYLEEGRQWLSQLLATSEGMQQRARADVLYGAGVLATVQNDNAAALAYLQAARTLAEQLDYAEVSAVILAHLGHLFRLGNDFATALPLHRESLEQARRLGDAPILAVSLTLYASTLIAEGRELPFAMHLLEEALADTQQRGDYWRMALALSAYGWAALHMGQLEQAIEVLHQSLALRQQLNDPVGSAEAQQDLALALYLQGDSAQAEARFRASLAMLREVGTFDPLPFALEGLAFLRAERDAPHALRLLAAAEGLREQLGSPLPPLTQPRQQQTMQRARAQLNEATFAAAWAAGRAHSASEAIDDAFHSS